MERAELLSSKFEVSLLKPLDDTEYLTRAWSKINKTTREMSNKSSRVVMYYNFNKNGYLTRSSHAFKRDRNRELSCNPQKDK